MGSFSSSTGVFTVLHRSFLTTLLGRFKRNFNLFFSIFFSSFTVLPPSRAPPCAGGQHFFSGRLRLKAFGGGWGIFVSPHHLQAHTKDTMTCHGTFTTSSFLPYDHNRVPCMYTYNSLHSTLLRYLYRIICTVLPRPLLYNNATPLLSLFPLYDVRVCLHRATPLPN